MCTSGLSNVLTDGQNLRPKCDPNPNLRSAQRAYCWIRFTTPHLWSVSRILAVLRYVCLAPTRREAESPLPVSDQKHIWGFRNVMHMLVPELMHLLGPPVQQHMLSVSPWGVPVLLLY